LIRDILFIFYYIYIQQFVNLLFQNYGELINIGILLSNNQIANSTEIVFVSKEANMIYIALSIVRCNNRGEFVGSNPIKIKIMAPKIFILWIAGCFNELSNWVTIMLFHDMKANRGD
jgi:hypothetical protein